MSRCGTASRRLLPRLAIGVVLVAGARAAAQTSETPETPFSAGELRAMDHGEIVVRPQTRASPSGGRLVGGTSWVVVDATPESVWHAATDYPRWVRFMPRLVALRVARRGRNPLLLLRHELGPVSAAYALGLRIDAAHRDLAFALDATYPHDIDAAYGFFRIQPYRQGRTIVVFGGMLDIGDGLARLLFEERIHYWALRVPQELKRWVESPEGRRRYAPAPAPADGR